MQQRKLERRQGAGVTPPGRSHWSHGTVAAYSWHGCTLHLIRGSEDRLWTPRLETDLGSIRLLLSVRWHMVWLWGQNLCIRSLLHTWPQHTQCIAPGHLSPPLQRHRTDFTLSALNQTMLSHAPGPRVPDIKNLELRLNSPEGDLFTARQGRTSSGGKTHMLEGFSVRAPVLSDFVLHY